MITTVIHIYYRELRKQENENHQYFTDGEVSLYNKYNYFTFHFF